MGYSKGVMVTYRDEVAWKPQRIEFHQIDALRASHPELTLVDQFKQSLEELFLLRNPTFRYAEDYSREFEAFYLQHLQSEPQAKVGNWYYLPWANTLVHYLSEDLHLELRTGRNRNLITREEQELYHKATVAILGLSVGSHVATTIAMTGGAKGLRLADPDTISSSNLNRIRAGFSVVGTSKVVLVARQVFEMNPYSDIRAYEEGLTESNLDELLAGVDVVVEEMDNPFFKIKVRELARERGIPVVMGTDNGDGLIVDIERFDLEKRRPLLHGKIGSLSSTAFKDLSPRELPRVAAKMAGADLAIPRMLKSVTEVGESLYSWPQLGTAANLCGSVVAYIVRRIILKDANIRSGRYQVNLDAIFESGYGHRWLSRKIAFFKFVRAMRGKK